MEFSRQEYWSGYPFPSPRDLPNPGIKPSSPALQVDSLPSELRWKPKYASWAIQSYMLLYLDLYILTICESCLVVSDSLQPHGLYSTWSSPGQNTGVGSLFLLQGIFPTQGSNPALLHCRWILYQLSYKGSPYINNSSIIKQ